MYLNEEPTDEVELTLIDGDAEYTAEATMDIDGDGLKDSATVETKDGNGKILYTDRDGDKRIDLATKFDENGEIVQQVQLEEESGTWVTPSTPIEFEIPTPVDPSTLPMIVLTPEGKQELTPPELDLDKNGVKDALIVKDDQGNSIIYVDQNADGIADLRQDFTIDGKLMTYERQPDNTWLLTQSARIENGDIVPDNENDQLASEETESWGGFASNTALAQIDPKTGEWTSR